MHWPPLWLSPGKSNYTGKYIGCQSRDTKKLPNYYSAWARLTSWRQNLMTLIYICLLYSQISVSFYSITSCQMNFQKIWPNIFERSGKKKFGEALHFFLLLHLSSFSLSSFFSVSCFAFFPTFCLYPLSNDAFRSDTKAFHSSKYQWIVKKAKTSRE